MRSRRHGRRCAHATRPDRLPAATAVDASVLVSALLTWHEHHAPARRALEETLTAGKAILPAHALVETYAVLTRLPPPHRLSPRDAGRLLSTSLKDRMTIRGLGEEVWPMIESVASRNIAGGSTYDAVILAEAIAAGAESILTLNRTDFERVAAEGITIRTV